MTLANMQAIEAATEAVLARDIRVLNGALFGADEAEHVAVLLEVMDPPENAMVLDLGCGVGEMARLMTVARPDLNFLLVNNSPGQLKLCPEEFDRLQADFNHLEVLPDGCADVVVFSFSICHSPSWTLTLNEARRLLKDGGILFINDMARLSGDNEAFEAVLGARAWEPEAVEAWARGAGFMLDAAMAPPVEVDRMAMLLGIDGIDASIMDGVVPTIWRFIALDEDAARWSRHEGRIAFQFSGGRDSTAALYLLRDRWADMRIYHVDTGDQFPETREVVEAVEADLADAGVELIRIHTSVQDLREQNGLPSDIVPVDNTAFGQKVSGEPLLLTGRYDCCASALMFPMHLRMEEDGITLIVRGQRDDEYATPPLRDGDSMEGFEVHYPVQDWSGDQVQDYLESNDLPIAPFYRAGMRRAPECMGCTAWWDEGRAAYMRTNHPEEHTLLMHSLTDIKRAIAAQSDWLTNELEA